MKRAYDTMEDGRPRKRHAIQNVQQMPPYTEPAVQEPNFTNEQLMRSITTACTIAGFESVTSSALEMFRTHTEEYMLRFAREVRVSMHGQRRARPTAQDFSLALSRMDNTRAARVLQPQLDLKLPKDISYPSISPPDPPSEEAPNFNRLLEPLIEQQPPLWIPQHFPSLPSQHAWKTTDVWPMRETDSRKMREKATEEGMLAEQALRKLAAAAKAGTMKAEMKRRQGLLAGAGKSRGVSAVKRSSNDDIFGEVLEGVDGASERDVNTSNRQAIGISDGLLVNASAAHWRGGKRQGVAF